MELSWSIDMDPLVWGVLLVLLILAVWFAIQTRFELVAAVLTLGGAIVALPLLPAFLFVDTLFFALIGRNELATGAGVLTVLSFVILWVLRWARR